jgi:hypothetical protein
LTAALHQYENWCRKRLFVHAPPCIHQREDGVHDEAKKEGLLKADGLLKALAPFMLVTSA